MTKLAIVLAGAGLTTIGLWGAMIRADRQSRPLTGPAPEPVSPAPAARLSDDEGSASIEVDVIARTLWGEARGLGRTGMEDVASVIENRHRQAKRGVNAWWGISRVEICLKPMQFSAWNRDDANRDRMLTVTPSDSAFRAALEIAADVVAGRHRDTVNGATHYHTRAVSPRWANTLAVVSDRGAHIFYA